MEQQAYEYFAKIDDLGGMVEAVKRGFPQHEIADAAFRYQQEVESGIRKVVVVNAYSRGDDSAPSIRRIDPAFETHQIERVREYRERRDQEKASAALAALEEAA